MSDAAARRLRRYLARRNSLVVTELKLDGANLSRRALLGVQFRSCELVGVDFRGADLSLARFINCDLYMADFRGSVLYTTWFYECNMTKADFREAYLLGFRLRSADITKTQFDEVPAVGLERKSRHQADSGVLKVPLLGELPAPAPRLENTYSGITMRGFDRVISFVRDTPESKPRTLIRIAETAKYLCSVHAENGYDARAAHYYVVERRLRRKATGGSLRTSLRRAYDFAFGELLWRYGTSIRRPIAGLAGLAALCALLTYFAPAASPGTGLINSQSGNTYHYVGWNSQSLVNFLNVAYFFITAPAGGSGAELTGWIKIVFVGYVLTALWLIAVIFDAFMRRAGAPK